MAMEPILRTLIANVAQTDRRGFRRCARCMTASVIYLTLLGGSGRIALWVLTGTWWRGWRRNSRSTGRMRMSGLAVLPGVGGGGYAREAGTSIAAAAAVVAVAAGVSRATVMAGRRAWRMGRNGCRDGCGAGRPAGRRRSRSRV
jgi:hypothetical protein